jgi:hypothetical protein
MKKLALDIQKNRDENSGKLSYEFITKLAEESEIIYVHPSPRTRICILVLETGHEVLGYARVLNVENDDEELGNKVAFDRAKDELWALCGSIALAL